MLIFIQFSHSRTHSQAWFGFILVYTLARFTIVIFLYFQAERNCCPKIIWYFPLWQSKDSSIIYCRKTKISTYNKSGALFWLHTMYNALYNVVWGFCYYARTWNSIWKLQIDRQKTISNWLCYQHNVTRRQNQQTFTLKVNKQWRYPQKWLFKFLVCAIYQKKKKIRQKLTECSVNINIKYEFRTSVSKFKPIIS